LIYAQSPLAASPRRVISEFGLRGRGLRQADHPQKSIRQSFHEPKPGGELDVVDTGVPSLVFSGFIVF
jgi:hypothetical protein